jgi:hypothetical protein
MSALAIDAALAVDYVLMAARGDYDAGDHLLPVAAGNISFDL